MTGRQDVTKREERHLRAVPGPEDGMTLAEQTARRLILAGITEDDPGLLAIREWNKAAYKRAANDPEYVAHLAKVREWKERQRGEEVQAQTRQGEPG